ncbi:PAS domain-containing sensor histidine kinase [Salinirubellus sp. GCM10025818]|uniref:sensor histidine kinase n=1 Tax=Salinirubellus TaxID=2162630 RepID=UPI0030D4B678
MEEEPAPDEQRRMLAQLFESTSDVVWMFSDDWEEVIFVNDAYEDLWGRSTEVLERDGTDFLEGVHPDDREALRAAMERISGGEPSEVEYRVNPEQGYRRWVWSRGRPIYDDDGEITRVAGVTRDVTERRRYEEELRRQNERLDEFASIVSHDLRSPLSVAQGRVSLARDECDCDQHLDPIADAIDRMGSIVDDTLVLAQQGRTVDDLEWIDAASLAEECWRMVGAADADATLEVDEPFRLRADPDRLRHALENLLGNALEHGVDDPTVRIGPTGETEFRVEDDGPGIPREEREEVFEPGYSTAEDGTGFGLAIVRRVADAHGCDVAVTGGADGGARFVFSDVELGPDHDP